MATFISKMHFRRQAATEVCSTVSSFSLIWCLFNFCILTEVNCFVSQDTRAPKKLKFVIDDCDDDDGEAGDDDDGEADDDDEEKGQLFDSVCAYCDDGGEILWYALFS